MDPRHLVRRLGGGEVEHLGVPDDRGVLLEARLEHPRRGGQRAPGAPRRHGHLHGCQCKSIYQAILSSQSYPNLLDFLEI